MSFIEDIANYWEQNALTCTTKSTLGLDCMGCGMQRSLIALLRGDVMHSINQYPATISLVIMFIFLGLHLLFKFEKGAKILLVLFLINVGLIIIPYAIKLFQIFG